MPNEYQLTPDYKTTGLDSIGPDINAYNAFGHTPVQVALQAGALHELERILADPACTPEKPSAAGHTTAWFLHVCIERRREKRLFSLDKPIKMKKLLTAAYKERGLSEMDAPGSAKPSRPSSVTFRATTVRLCDIYI
ncbi:MAG: hypothetical protein PHY92_04825 [Alphaproteobacteria bacterium]|nr:hypothetical protein [Alphaproteobacteria bacterium]